MIDQPHYIIKDSMNKDSMIIETNLSQNNKTNDY